MPPPHRVTAAGFTALGAGDADPATVSVLRRAQLSRHLLLLREVLRSAADAAEVPAWFAVLSAAERAAPDRVRQVLGHPPVGAWAADCLACLRAGDPSRLPYLGGLAAAAALHAGHAARLSVPVCDGRLALPGLGTAVLPGRREAVVDTGARTVTAGPCTVAVPPDPSVDGPGWLGLRRLTSRHDDLPVTLLLDDLDPHRAGPGLSVTGRLTDAQADRWGQLLDGAWRLLVGRHRAHAEAVAGDLRELVPVHDDAGAGGISATARHAFGSVAMSLPADPTALAAGLVHEARHNRLNAVQYLFQLFDPAERTPLYSPWRDDPRPPGGVLHGAYAYLGVTDFWRVERHTGGPVGHFAFARWRRAVADTCAALLAGGHLTGPGVRFVAAMLATAERWSAEPVPADVLPWAERANTDHRLRWRLRHLHPTAADVQRLAAAWRAGGPPPDAPVYGLVHLAAGRQLEHNDRLLRVMARLRGAAPAAGGSPGDRAYADGALDAATAAYRQAVVTHPGDDAAWAGLALADPAPALLRCPELVAAVYRALRLPGGEGPDLDRLVAWLAPVRYAADPAPAAAAD